MLLRHHHTTRSKKFTHNGMDGDESMWMKCTLLRWVCCVCECVVCECTYSVVCRQFPRLFVSRVFTCFMNERKNRFSFSSSCLSVQSWLSFIHSSIFSCSLYRSACKMPVFAACTDEYGHFLLLFIVNEGDGKKLINVSRKIKFDEKHECAIVSGVFEYTRSIKWTNNIHFI